MAIVSAFILSDDGAVVVALGNTLEFVIVLGNSDVSIPDTGVVVVRTNILLEDTPLELAGRNDLG
jgi:hypothetical protein